MQSKLLPDLWLKMELASATILPTDFAAPLVNSEFIRYVRGDGDRLDTIRVLAPSQTQTHRYGLISSLRYE